MTLADSATTAFAVTAVCAVAARLVGALTTDGAVAGAVVGACVSAGFGLPGLAVLGTFFVVGTLATRIGWKTKKARGTAEAGEGRRDWKRVVGKGGVAAAIALSACALSTQWVPGWFDLWLGFSGAVAAALADTLATEIGTLSPSQPRSLPLLRRVPTGTAGAVSFRGIAAATLGAAIVARLAAWIAKAPEEPANPMLTMQPATGVMATMSEWLLDGTFQLTLAGLWASLLESLAVGLGLRAPGFVRNVLTTLAGAAIGGAYWLLWGLT